MHKEPPAKTILRCWALGSCRFACQSLKGDSGASSFCGGGGGRGGGVSRQVKGARYLRKGRPTASTAPFRSNIAFSPAMLVNLELKLQRCKHRWQTRNLEMAKPQTGLAYPARTRRASNPPQVRLPPLTKEGLRFPGSHATHMVPQEAPPAQLWDMLFAARGRFSITQAGTNCWLVLGFGG